MKEKVKIMAFAKSKHSFLKLPVSLLLLFILSANHCFATESGTLKGRITESSGIVLPDAQIRIQRWGMDELHRPKIIFEKVLYTNSTGEYLISLEPGTYDVFISGRGCYPRATKIEIKATKINIWNPVLKPSKGTKYIS